MKNNRIRSFGGFGIHHFIKDATIGGFILVIAVIIAMIWANSSLYESYHYLWHELELGISFGDFELKGELHHWVNDGLMAIFFFTVGLEIKREVIAGELSSMKKASLPVAAAIGGMIVPASIYFLVNINNPDYINGSGIPMATDIAFTLGLLSLLGNKVPLNLKVFLTALAVADDLGAILVIAIFYTDSINTMELLNAGIFLLVLIIANRIGIRRPLFYAVVGILGVWLAFVFSGVHATIAGVLIAMTIPVKRKISEKNFMKKIGEKVDDFHNEKTENQDLLSDKQADIVNDIEKISYQVNTPLQKLEHALHPVNTYFILPVFALASAGVRIEGNIFDMIFHPISIGIICGLVIGKFLGISIITRIMVWLKWGALPEKVNWGHIYGAGLLAGFGFTMSIFISELAFVNDEYIQIAKIGIFCASIIAAILGLTFLSRVKNSE